MKDKSHGKILTKLFGLRSKTYSYLIDDGSEDKKAKDTKKSANLRIQFENKVNYLEKNKINIDSLKK